MLLGVIAFKLPSIVYRTQRTIAHAGKSIFDFEVTAIQDGKVVSLSQYKGKKAYLVVNVASKWGLTSQNYAEMKQVYDKYR